MAHVKKEIAADKSQKTPSVVVKRRRRHKHFAVTTSGRLKPQGGNRRGDRFSAPVARPTLIAHRAWNSASTTQRGHAKTGHPHSSTGGIPLWVGLQVGAFRGRVDADFGTKPGHPHGIS